jgi:hypothetical protein
MLLQLSDAPILSRNGHQKNPESEHTDNVHHQAKKIVNFLRAIFPTFVKKKNLLVLMYVTVSEEMSRLVYTMETMHIKKRLSKFFIRQLMHK